ncbi:MAG TPA: hypothetical protein VGX48_23060 [Pyrinomonadaceae bacterium]|jgi:hypothetical protein|nr:hypothetical protein [Pyrinomonadaceae bacterium]
MNATPHRFVRRTTLGEDEYRRNFRQIDHDVIELLKSAEARKVTRLMGTLYLTLIDAPPRYWEREGVLRFTGDVGDVGTQTAWQQLVGLLDCGNTTAKKALDWMHEQGIIGYYAGKNGVGIRIFLNRAVSSIGRRGGQKNLRLVRTPVSESPAPAAGTPFSDSFAVLEVSETDLIPRAPKNGAEQATVVKQAPDSITPGFPNPPQSATASVGTPPRPPVRVEVPVEEIVSRLSRELGPSLQSAARRAAAQEHERTRDWLESRGLPKAARVAQREAYNVLRKYGVIRDAAQAAPADLGRGGDPTREPHPLADGEVEELAQACVAMLEVKGQSVERTLSEMSAEAGGFLLPADVRRVRSVAEALLDNSRQ